MGDGFMSPPYEQHTPHLRFVFENHGKTPAFLRLAKYELRSLPEPVRTAPAFEKPTTRQDRDVIAGEKRYGGDSEVDREVMEIGVTLAANRRGIRGLVDADQIIAR